MKFPAPIYLKPGSDPSTQEYPTPGFTLTGCLIIILSLVGALWAFYVVAKLSSSKSVAQAPTLAFSLTPQTPTITSTPTITFTPSGTPTGTLLPTDTPTITVTPCPEQRIWCGLVTATAFPTLTPTSSPTAIPPSRTPRPIPTRRLSGGSRGTGGSNPPPPATHAAQPPPPIIPPTYTALPPWWQPTPIWDGHMLPTVDYSTPIPSPYFIATVVDDSRPTLTATSTPSPTPTETLEVLP